MPGFDPDQPRDEKGQWTSTGMASALRSAASDQFTRMKPGEVREPPDTSNLPKDIVKGEKVITDPITGQRRLPIEAESDITKQALIQAASDATVGGAIDLQKIDPEFREPVLKELINDQLADKSIEEKLEVVENAIKLQPYESAAVFDNDGKLIKFADGDELSVGIKPSALKGAAVMTHNHPMDVSFSNGDIYATLSNNIKEVRATTIDSVNVFRPNYNFRYVDPEDSFTTQSFAAEKSPFFSYMMVYDEEAKKVINELQYQIKHNLITPQKANHEFQHLTINAVANRTGSYYKVIPKPIPANVSRLSPLFGEPEYEYFDPEKFATR